MLGALSSNHFWNLSKGVGGISTLVDRGDIFSLEGVYSLFSLLLSLFSVRGRLSLESGTKVVHEVVQNPCNALSFCNISGTQGGTKVVHEAFSHLKNRTSRGCFHPHLRANVRRGIGEERVSRSRYASASLNTLSLRHISEEKKADGILIFAIRNSALCVKILLL